MAKTGRPRRLDGRGLAAFVGALEKGATVKAAAKAAGFALSTFYHRRQADPAFLEAWDAAMEASRVPVLIAPANGRRLQKQKMRNARFTADRKEIYLSHFASTCDGKAAAEAAGVGETTVSSHRRDDPAFAEAWDAALEQGYAELEAEALRQQLEAQQRYREALRHGSGQAGEAARSGKNEAERGTADSPAASPSPEEEGRTEFERTLKLLQLYRRGAGSVGPRKVRRERLTRWSFEEAMAALEKKLKAFRVRIEEEAPPPRRVPSPTPANPGEDR